MCLILIAYRCHPRYEFVAAANRDEFHARPTAPLAEWNDAPGLWAGRDLQAGGTWLGLTRTGRFAAVTNYRDPGAFRPNAPSRGALASDFLSGREAARAYLGRVADRAALYNGFNLLMRDGAGLYYFSNRSGAAPLALEPGIHGLSNHLLNTPWPKVERGRAKLAAALEINDGEPLVENLLSLLEDRWQPSGAELPNTGVGANRERQLAPMFIATPEYGTRSSTVVLMAHDGATRIIEKTHSDGALREFRWDSANPGSAQG
ncbi:MAG: NRDE family protein [Gammaproteobacteria bacterium]